MQKFLLKFALSPKFMIPELTDNNHHKCLREKTLHGKFFCQQEEIPQVDLTQSHQQLCRAQLPLRPRQLYALLRSRLW
eukprot:13017743-Ditylum_brightwellii.AAC.2